MLDDEEAGANFSSEKAFGGADWLLFSPQSENVTTPWMADAPPSCRVRHLLDREGAPLAGMYSRTGTLLPLSVATDPTMAVAF